MKTKMDTLDKTRKSLKKAGENIELPMDAAFFDNLHDKIMARVAETEIEAKPPATVLGAPKKFLKKQWKSWLYPAGSTMALALVGTMLTMQFSQTLNSSIASKPLSPQSEKVVSAALESPDAISQTLLSSQTEADFFVDVASQSFENLNIAQFNKIMGEIQ